MNQAIEAIKRELESTENLIEHYLKQGNPSIEILQPNQFQKVEDLNQALLLLEKYGAPSITCNISSVTTI